jgi:hypothetical protein
MDTSEQRVKLKFDYTVLVFPMDLLKAFQQHVKFYSEDWKAGVGYHLVPKEKGFEVEISLVSVNDLPTSNVVELSMKEVIEENNRLTRENEYLTEECNRLKKPVGTDVVL